MNFKFISTETVFCGEDGQRYSVRFTGSRPNLQFAVFKNHVPIRTGECEYGHANKTKALQILQQTNLK